MAKVESSIFPTFTGLVGGNQPGKCADKREAQLIEVLNCQEIPDARGYKSKAVWFY